MIGAENPHCVPYLGRDYKSAKAVMQDWMANRDFLINLTGQTISKSAADLASCEEINIRYKQLTMVVVIKKIKGIWHYNGKKLS